jgi:hypothetical protein
MADRNGRPHVVPAGFNMGDRDDCFGVGEVNQQALFGRVAAVEHHGAGTTTTTAAYRTPIAAPARVREEVDPGQIHVPARGFDIVDKVVAPVGGGGSRGVRSRRFP